MRILFFGAAGWIGSQLYDMLKDEHEVIASHNRVDDSPVISQQLDTLQPDRVVVATGRTTGPECNTIDYLEPPEMLSINIRDNLYAVIALAQQCQQRGLHMTYLGTGCIFQYSPTHPSPYTEDDTPNFTGSAYSTVKGYTDRLLHLYPNVLNVRLRLPITAKKHPKNLITKLANYRRVHDIPNSVTVLESMLPVLVQAITQGHTGTVNLVNPGTITPAEIMTLYQTYVDSGHEFTVSYEPSPANRSQTELSTTLLTERYGPMMTAKEAVTAVLQSYKLN